MSSGLQQLPQRAAASYDQTRSVMPITSWPCSLSSAAAADESTPPLIATTNLIASFLHSLSTSWRCRPNRFCQEIKNCSNPLRCPPMSQFSKRNWLQEPRMEPRSPAGDENEDWSAGACG